VRITKRACDDLAKRPAGEIVGRPAFWDDATPGFGARLNGPGRLSFVLRYRVKGEKNQRLVTLGDFPATSPDAARTEASAIKAAARAGRDLLADRRSTIEAEASERRQAQLRGLPLTDLLDAWRAAAEQAMAAKAARGESVLYERELLRLEAKLLRPAVGDATAGMLDPDRFQALLHLQTSVSTARNLRNLLVRFVKHANAEMVRRGVPGVRWPTKFEVEGRPRSRSDRYTLEQAAKLWIGAGALGRRGALVRFMLLTGCRRIEAQRAGWDHVVLDDAVLGAHWNQPSSLTKNHLPHRVPLSEPAVALLRWLPPRETRRAGRADLIFAGRGGKPVGGWTEIRRALLAAAAVDTGTLHDFRRTIVSTLGDHGFDPQVADTLLNHAAAATMGGVMGVYQRSELWVRRREAIDLWTRLLMEAVGQRLGRPVCRETWGFDAPFEDARISRHRLQAASDALPRKVRGGARPRSETPISARSHSSRSSAR
jgi:integrase